jgi:hypothetical protein
MQDFFKMWCEILARRAFFFRAVVFSLQNNVDAVNTATTALQNALNALVRVETPAPAPTVDKTALNGLIMLADAKQQATYTADSWMAFSTALTSAKQIAAKADATAGEVTMALTALQIAMDGLALNATTPPATNTGFSPVVVGAVAILGVGVTACVASPIAFAIGKKRG